MNIHLTKSRIAIIDDSDAELIERYPWCVSHQGYAVRRNPENGGVILMHRFISGAKEGQWVDHIAMNKLDNRRENLRVCSAAQNHCNKTKQNRKCSSVFKGVCFLKGIGKWLAYAGGRKGSFAPRKYLGKFDSEVEAARAYDSAAKEMFGPFAKLNF